MLRPEYSNLYKFLVSTGLILIALAVAAPWIVGKLSDGLLISEAELEGLAPPARDLWDARRSMAERAAGVWPWVSGIFLVLGAVATVFGLTKWNPQQVRADDLEKTQLDRARLEIANMSRSEIAAETEREALDEAGDPAAGPLATRASLTRQSVEEVTRTIAEIESQVFRLLQASLKHGHYGRTHVRVDAAGRLMMLDALFEARDPAYVDVIVEVKYLRAASRISHAMIQLAHHADAYVAATGREVDPLLIFVIGGAWGPDDEHRARDIRRKLVTAMNELGALVKVATLQEDELDHLQPDTFYMKLPRGIGQRGRSTG